MSTTADASWRYPSGGEKTTTTATAAAAAAQQQQSPSTTASAQSPPPPAAVAASVRRYLDDGSTVASAALRGLDAEHAGAAALSACVDRARRELPAVLGRCRAEAAAKDSEIAALRAVIAQQQRAGPVSTWCPPYEVDADSDEDPHAEESEIHNFLSTLQEGEEEEGDGDEDDDAAVCAFLLEDEGEGEGEGAAEGRTALRAVGGSTLPPLPEESPPRIDRRPVRPVTVTKQSYDKGHATPNFEHFSPS